jgi:uncharacterized protein YbjT (DUF2867 family)
LKSCLVAGASGLIGSALVKLLLETPEYSQVHILVRKPLDIDHPKLVQHLVEFDKLSSVLLDFKVTDAFCTLGTTIGKAGSKNAFYAVDHDYVIAFAKLALVLNASGFYVVSSMGALATSPVFYNKVKGEMEEDLKKIGFQRLCIFRPSLLLGPRQERRIGEKLAGWLMNAFDFLIPLKYKAIHVDKVAKKMVHVALKEENGIGIFESDQLQ